MLLADARRGDRRRRATSSRLAKIAALADVLRELAPDEIPPAIGFLTASPRQGRDRRGVAQPHRARCGARRRRRAEVLDVDAALDRPRRRSGCRFGSRRARASLESLAARATAAEWDFLARVILGELRTGALEGVLLDAVAKAADRPAATVRRAAMLSGDLGETALHRAHRLRRRPRRRRPRGRPTGQPMLASTAGSVAEAIQSLGRRHPSSTSSTGRASRCTAMATTCGSITRNLADITHRVPEIVDVVRALPVDRRHPRRRDPVARRGRRPAAVPGHHVAIRVRGRRLDRTATVVLRHPASRRPRSDRRAARDAAATCSSRSRGSSVCPGSSRMIRMPRPTRLTRSPRRWARGRDGQGDRLGRTPPAGAARAGSRSSRCSRSTWSSSRWSGDRVAAPDSCRTSISGARDPRRRVR